MYEYKVLVRCLDCFDLVVAVCIFSGRIWHLQEMRSQFLVLELELFLFHFGAETEKETSVLLFKQNDWFLLDPLDAVSCLPSKLKTIAGQLTKLLLSCSIKHWKKHTNKL